MTRNPRLEAFLRARYEYDSCEPKPRVRCEANLVCMNAEAWGGGYMADPQYYASKGYPAWKEWPHGEALWNAPYCFVPALAAPARTPSPRIHASRIPRLHMSTSC